MPRRARPARRSGSTPTAVRYPDVGVFPDAGRSSRPLGDRPAAGIRSPAGGGGAATSSLCPTPCRAGRIEAGAEAGRGGGAGAASAAGGRAARSRALRPAAPRRGPRPRPGGGARARPTPPPRLPAAGVDARGAPPAAPDVRRPEPLRRRAVARRRVAPAQAVEKLGRHAGRPPVAGSTMAARSGSRAVAVPTAAGGEARLLLELVRRRAPAALAPLPLHPSPAAPSSSARPWGPCALFRLFAPPEPSAARSPSPFPLGRDRASSPSWPPALRHRSRASTSIAAPARARTAQRSSRLRHPPHGYGPDRALRCDPRGAHTRRAGAAAAAGAPLRLP